MGVFYQNMRNTWTGTKEEQKGSTGRQNWDRYDQERNKRRTKGEQKGNKRETKGKERRKFMKILQKLRKILDKTGKQKLNKTCTELKSTRKMNKGAIKVGN